MKALSIRQPWASLIAIGKKTIETRTWPTNYRGKLLIVSSKIIDKNIPYRHFLELGLPLGKAIAIVELVDCRPMRKPDEIRAMCNFYFGLYAWELENIKRIKPFSVKGKLGLYEVDVEAEQAK